MVSLHGLDALVVVAVEEHVAREEGEHRPDLAPARRPALVSHAASDADRGTDRLGTAKVSTNSWGSGRGRLRRAPCPGGLQALPDAGSARTLPRWAAGENYGVRRLDRYILSMRRMTLMATMCRRLTLIKIHLKTEITTRKCSVALPGFRGVRVNHPATDYNPPLTARSSGELARTPQDREIDP